MHKVNLAIVTILLFNFVAGIFFVCGLEFKDYQIYETLITNACEKTYKLHKDYINCLDKTKLKDLTLVFKNRECKK